MRKWIIAGSYAQYRDYLVREKVAPQAAPYVAKPEDLRALNPGDKVELVGDYQRSPAYSAYLAMMAPRAISQ